MKRIRLAADYYCFPLWWAGGEDVGNINPDSLPISSALQKSLMQWSDDFDARFNKEDPAESGFETDEKAEVFQIRGLRLWFALQKELKNQYHVAFRRWSRQHPLQAYHFTLPQYVMLMNRVFGDQLPLDQTALDDLQMSKQDMKVGETGLVENGIILSDSDKSINAIHQDVRTILAILLSPKTQITADYKFSDRTGTQITIGFDSDNIAAEVTNIPTGERTLMDLAINQDAVELLLLNSREFINSKTGETSPLSDLLEKADVIVNVSRLERSGEDAFEAIKAVIWIITKDGLWWIDHTNREEVALSISKEQLRQKLSLFSSQ